VSSVLSDLTYDQIKQHRGEVEDLVKSDLNLHFKDRGLDCEGFLLGEIRYPKQYQSQPQYGQNLDQAITSS
jgi:hypothetical protein